MWLLHRLRFELDRVKREVAPVKLGLGLGPQRLEHAHALTRAAGARVEVDRRGRKLFRQPAHPDTELETPVRQHVEGHRHARRLQWMTERKNINVRAETNTFGARGD